MTVYDKTGDVNIRVAIGGIVFNILLTQSFFNPGYSRTSINHNHSLYEVHFLDSGNEELMVCEEKTMFSPGTYFLIGPGIYHAHKFQEGDLQPGTYCLRFDFETAGTADPFSPIQESGKSQGCFPVSNISTPKMSMAASRSSGRSTMSSTADSWGILPGSSPFLSRSLSTSCVPYPLKRSRSRVSGSGPRRSAAARSSSISLRRTLTPTSPPQIWQNASMSATAR